MKILRVLNTFPVLNICLGFKCFPSTVSCGNFLAQGAATSATLHHGRIEQDTSQLPSYVWVPPHSVHLTCICFLILSTKYPRENTKFLMFFPLSCPELFSLKVDSKKFSLPSDHSIITGKFKIPVFQNYITMMHFIRHWLTICS